MKNQSFFLVKFLVEICRVRLFIFYIKFGDRFFFQKKT